MAGTKKEWISDWLTTNNFSHLMEAQMPSGLGGNWKSAPNLRRNWVRTSPGVSSPFTAGNGQLSSASRPMNDVKECGWSQKQGFWLASTSEDWRTVKARKLAWIVRMMLFWRLKTVRMNSYCNSLEAGYVHACVLQHGLPIYILRSPVWVGMPDTESTPMVVRNLRKLWSLSLGVGTTIDNLQWELSCGVATRAKKSSYHSPGSLLWPEIMTMLPSTQCTQFVFTTYMY